MNLLLGFSSNINEVIKTVLNFLLIYFFYEKILHSLKSTKKHQKGHKHNQAKAQIRK